MTTWDDYLISVAKNVNGVTFETVRRLWQMPELRALPKPRSAVIDGVVEFFWDINGSALTIDVDEDGNVDWYCSEDDPPHGLGKGYGTLDHERSAIVDAVKAFVAVTNATSDPLLRRPVSK